MLNFFHAASFCTMLMSGALWFLDGWGTASWVCIISGILFIIITICRVGISDNGTADWLDSGGDWGGGGDSGGDGGGGGD